MELMMYLGNDFIESIALDRSLISKPGYLGQFKRQLKVKYQNLLQEAVELPEFLVVMPKSTNNMSLQAFSLS